MYFSGQISDSQSHGQRCSHAFPYGNVCLPLASISHYGIVALDKPLHDRYQQLLATAKPIRSLRCKQETLAKMAGLELSPSLDELIVSAVYDSSQLAAFLAERRLRFVGSLVVDDEVDDGLLQALESTHVHELTFTNVEARSDFDNLLKSQIRVAKLNFDGNFDEFFPKDNE